MYRTKNSTFIVITCRQNKKYVTLSVFLSPVHSDIQVYPTHLGLSDPHPGGGGGVTQPKLRYRESGSGQSSYRRGNHIPIALHLEVVYKIRWLQ